MVCEYVRICTMWHISFVLLHSSFNSNNDIGWSVSWTTKHQRDTPLQVCICWSCNNFTTMCRIDNYVLQVTGEENYITGDIRLLDFKAVRRYSINSLGIINKNPYRAIFKKQDLHLSVVNKPLLFKDQLHAINVCMYNYIYYNVCIWHKLHTYGLCHVWYPNIVASGGSLHWHSTYS